MSVPNFTSFKTSFEQPQDSFRKAVWITPPGGGRVAEGKKASPEWAPGFPDDGTWMVRYEGLNRAP